METNEILKISFATFAILVGVFVFIASVILIVDSIVNAEDCYYELKDNVTCENIQLYYNSVTLRGCSDGYVHTAEPYKEVCLEK